MTKAYAKAAKPRKALHSVTAVAPNARKFRGDRPQTAVAAKVGITQSCYSRIERGEFAPSLDTFLRIADALDVEPGDLTRLVA